MREVGKPRVRSVRRLAVLLAILGAVLGAVAGWYFAGEPEFRSNGLVQINPILPKVMYETEQTRIMPMFDSFVASQMELMRNRRVINLAMQEDVWREAGADPDLQDAEEFGKVLDVSLVGGGDMIQVQFDHPRRAVAVAAVKSVLVAYRDLYRERYSRRETKRLQILEDRQGSLRNELASYQDRIKQIGDQYGSEELREMHQFKLKEMQNVESQLRRVQIELAQIVAAKSQPSDQKSDAEAVAPRTDGGGTEPVELTIEQIAVFDGEMRGLLADKQRIELAILERAHRLRASSASKEPTLAPTLEQKLRLHATKLKSLHGQLQSESRELGRRDLEIRRLRDQASMVEQRLADTRNRIEVLNVEAFSRVSGRIDVISVGEDTSVISSDRGSQAAAGGVVGAVLAVAAVALIGLLGRGYRRRPMRIQTEGR